MTYMTSVYPLTLGDIYVGIPFNLGRHICRLTSKRVEAILFSFTRQLYTVIDTFICLFVYCVLQLCDLLGNAVTDSIHKDVRHMQQWRHHMTMHGL